MSSELYTFEAGLLDDVPSLMALRAGFRFGVFGALHKGPILFEDLLQSSKLARKGALLLVQMLKSCGMIQVNNDEIALTSQMRALLEAEGKDLRTKADFTALAVCDVLSQGDALLSDPEMFLRAAQTFRFFRYDRALGTGAANLQDSSPWVDYVSALTAREAPELASGIDLRDARHVLEIGGNTGVFAQSLLTLNPQLKATIIDLPAVCRLGEQRMCGSEIEERLRFLPGDAREIDWPEADTVLFKSVLHDWSEKGVAQMLRKAAAHIPDGGRIIICERGSMSDEETFRGALVAANLVFSQYYRSPDLYRGLLMGCNMKLQADIEVVLDMTFHITVAEKVQ